MVLHVFQVPTSTDDNLLATMTNVTTQEELKSDKSRGQKFQIRPEPEIHRSEVEDRGGHETAKFLEMTLSTN